MTDERSNSNTVGNEDIEGRQSRWGSLIADLEDGWDADSDDDENIVAPGVSLNGLGGMTNCGISSMGTASGRMVTPPATATFSNSPSSRKSLSFPSWSAAGRGGVGVGGISSGIGGGGAAGNRSPHLHLTIGATTLRAWIASHRGNSGDNKIMEIGERRKYLETSVKILHSLVGKIGGYTRSNKGVTGREEIYAHPKFITLDNTIVRQKNLLAGEFSADFVESGDSIFYSEGQADDNVRKKYLAMDALGRLAYNIFTMGEGPDVFRGRGGYAMGCASNALSLHDGTTMKDVDTDEEDKIINMLRKTARTTTSEQEAGNNGGIIPAMLSASVPFPLCRLVSDLLLDDEHSVFGRSHHSFSNFADVLSDLKQMVDDPDSFLHNSHPDRWKLVFGEKLYGRNEHTKTFMDAANRMSMIRGDPIFDGLMSLMGKRKEVIMVSGHSGSGKSRLVRLMGTSLEQQGWRFLRCKFDRVVHPEPLSILAYAFDEYFGTFTTCPSHGSYNSDDLFPSYDLECSCSARKAICERLESILCSEELGMLAKHIPSLKLVVKNVQYPPDTIEVNETIIHTLFGKLLQVLSSKRAPVLFFIDDLQWVDPLSLALLTALIKGARPDLLSLSSTAENKQNNNQFLDEDTSVIFVGSYRDNEVDDGHPLSKVLCKFQSDGSVNLTQISLLGFGVDTLNEMLSESLRMPLRRVRSLSEMVIQKTDGQPLHVIEFVQALTMDNLLTHSFDRGWEWDADSIDICPITDSVAELFALKLRRLPPDILLGLQILSCFGSQIDQHVLGLVSDYDGENSVDIARAIRAATSEGLVERASSLVSFAHDMIQKATIDSIRDEATLVELLRKLVRALIENASAADELNSVLYVAVDLINRIGSDATPSPKERALFAGLNSRAGSKAIKVPDFAGAAKYAENGISFLNVNCWEEQYELSLGLFETAVLSHFSSLEGDRDRLTQRIDAVFDHAKDFSDEFNTRCVWIKLLSMTDLSKATAESLNALEQLGEPLDLTGIDFAACRDELVKRKEQLSGERKNKFLSSNHLLDENKVRAMKIMSSLIVYYHMQKSFLGSYISSRMIEMSMDNGHCEHSVFGAAVFASALVNNLEDINEGSAWGRTTLSLMKMYDKEILVPSINSTLYGMVFVWTEPLQSTLEPLAQGIRQSFAMGNVEFAIINTMYYIARSFRSGKNIRVLARELEALACQHGNRFGNDASSGTPLYSPLLQYYLTPLYIILRGLEEEKKDLPKEEEEAIFPWEKIQHINNDDIMDVALKTEQFLCFHSILSYETMKAVICRDMDNALKLMDLYVEHFQLKIKDLKLKYAVTHHIFYEALINFHFARLMDKDLHRIRGENAFRQIQVWSNYSNWNFLNKLLLIEAELHYTGKDFDRAAKCYEASIEAARKHMFIHEEAVASELAGIFFLDIGLLPKAKMYFLHAIECFKNWGAFVVARRVEASVRSNFGADSIQPRTVNDLPLESVIALKEVASRKRQCED